MPYEEELERKQAALSGVVPKRPPSKQAMVDSMFLQIEEKLKNGATFTQIRDALFPNLALTSFKTMFYRARNKKTGGDGGAAASPTPGLRPAPASAVGAPRKSKGSPLEGSPERQAVPSAAALEKEGGGEFELSDEQQELLIGTAGKKMTIQDERIPPPWSELPVSIDDVPDDLPNHKILRTQKTWFAVHFYLQTFRRIESGDLHDPFMGETPNVIVLNNLMRNFYPRSDSWANQLQHRNDKNTKSNTKIKTNDRQMDMQ